MYPSTHHKFTRIIIVVILITLVWNLPASSIFAGSTQQVPAPDQNTHFLPFLTSGPLASGPIDSSPIAEEPAQSETSQQHQAEKMQVARVTIQSAADVRYLSDNYDVWEEAISQQDYVTIYGSESELRAIEQKGYRVETDQLRTASLHSTRDFYNGQQLFASAIEAIPGYACYRTVEETYSDLAQLAADNPDLATWIDIGNSWNKATAGGPAGYDINLLKLTSNVISGPKPDLMIISAVHAREYTTAETNTRFAEHLVNNYGIDPDVTWLLDYNEIHILPQGNPDGRKIAETGDLWRKNVNPTNGCGFGRYGVDLNRNSSFQWGGVGSSANTCGQTYRGPVPVSEPEVAAIEDYASSIFADYRGPALTDAASADTEGIFITIHSYSELVLLPWGWTEDLSPNHDQISTLGRKFGYFNGYEVCNDCLYVADGVNSDFVYGTFGVPSFTYELGTAFFQDCETFENTIYPDNLPSLIYAAKAARLPYQTPLGPEAVNLALDASDVSAGTPVVLTATIDDTRTNSNGQGNEPTQNIQAARYSIDQPSWAGGATQPLNVADGAFNQQLENVTATIDTQGLSQGRHTIFVEGQDADGNWGVPTATFLNVTAAVPLVLGDVDCDLDADLVDALFILQYTVGLRADVGSCPLMDPANELVTSNGDVNGDEAITPLDALFVLQCTVEISNTFCP